MIASCLLAAGAVAAFFFGTGFQSSGHPTYSLLSFVVAATFGISSFLAWVLGTLEL